MSVQTKLIPWDEGGGNIVLTFGGEGDGQMTVASDTPNPLFTERSQTVTVGTTAGSPERQVQVTVKQKSSAHEALVDAWIMSGLKNEDAPQDVVGLKGNPMHMQGFAYTAESGFNTTDYPGALVFDGVDDCCISDAHNEWLTDDMTVIFKCSRCLNESNTKEMKLFSRGDSLNNGFFIYEHFYMDAVRYNACFGNFKTVVSDVFNDGVNVWTKARFNGKELSQSDKPFTYNYLCFGAMCDNNSNVPTDFCPYALYYFALYNRSLTDDEIAAEKVLLEQEWEKRMNV